MYVSYLFVFTCPPKHPKDAKEGLSFLMKYGPGERPRFQINNRSPHPMFCERTAKVGETGQGMEVLGIENFFLAGLRATSHELRALVHSFPIARGSKLEY
jgi:hypothetical protein